MSDFADGVNKFHVMSHQRNSMHCESYKDRLDVAMAMLRINAREKPLSADKLQETIKEFDAVYKHMHEVVAQMRHEIYAE